MRFLNKMERKFGKYAIRNLSVIIIAMYIAGYLIKIFDPSVGGVRLINYLYLSPSLIVKGQVWRLVSWLLIPPYSLDILTIITLFFYFSIGRTLEQTWGPFRFDLYIFSGIIFTVIGSFLLYFIGHIENGAFSTYYICMSMFLAFAVEFPNMQVLLMFIIPIKMKWLGLVYGIILVISMIQGSWDTRVAIFASLLNFVIYFFMTRDLNRYNPHEVHRRNEFKKNVKKVQPKPGAAKHRCAICGRTEADGEHLEFRYCSKCEGNYEYCQDHLFTHEHIKKGNK